MNIKFLDKVYDQILSETRIIDNKLYTPSSSTSTYLSLSFSFIPFLFPLFSSHCKEVYSLNEQEIDYVWNEYKKGITTLINDKELV